MARLLDETTHKIALKPAPGFDDNCFYQLKATRNPELREKTICHYIYLVNRIARKASFVHKEAFDDLTQIGYIGLIKAVDHFNPEKEVKFITYATHQIIGEIRHYLRDKISSIKSPRWLSQLNCQMAQSLNVLMQRLKRFPTIEELSKEMNITEEGLLELLRMNQLLSSQSLDDREHSQELFGKIEKIRSRELRDFQLPIEDQLTLHQALEKLRLFERRIVFLFFFYDLTQSEIGQQLGISQKQVSRIIQKSLNKLKEILFKELW